MKNVHRSFRSPGAGLVALEPRLPYFNHSAEWDLHLEDSRRDDFPGASDRIRTSAGRGRLEILVRVPQPGG